MKLTKEIVDALLAANNGNRRVSPRHYKSIAEAMRRSEFVPNNGQTIVCNKSMTRLLDGQHRLLAIREAGYPVFDIPLVVVEDDDAQKVFETIDVNSTPRSISSVIALKGEMRSSDVLVPIAKGLAFFAWGETQTTVARVEEIVKAIHPFLETIHYCRRYFGKKVPICVFAGAANAALIAPSEKERIAADFNSIFDGVQKPAVKSLIPIISGIVKPSRTDVFFRTTKVMLEPNNKRVVITDLADLKSAKI